MRRRTNRTLVIPRGILDSNVTNVVLIPNDLEDPNQSLVVRAPAHNRSLPITGDRRFYWHNAPRFATSFQGTPGYRHRPDHFERDFDVPVGISSPQDTVDDDYYFDMYDSDEDAFVGGESGNLSGSVMERLLGGELNRISGVEDEEEAQATQNSLQPPPFMIESPISSFHDSMVDPSGYEASSEPYMMSHYTPLSQSISVPHASYIWPIPANCEPCLESGRFDLCPQTCPVRRGVPFANPNVPAYLPQIDPFLEKYLDDKSETGPILAGTPPVLNRTRPIEPTPFLDQTRPRLNLTRPGPSGRPALNRTGPVETPMNLNLTRPTAPVLNRTRSATVNLNQTRPGTADLNRTRPTAAGTRGLNTTGPVVSQTGSRLNLNVTVELPAVPAPNVTPAVRSRTRIPVSVNRMRAARQRAAPPMLPQPLPQPLPPLLIPPPPFPIGLRRRQPQQPQQRQQRPRQTQSRGSCNPCPGPAPRKPWR